MSPFPVVPFSGSAGFVALLELQTTQGIVMIRGGLAVEVGVGLHPAEGVIGPVLTDGHIVHGREGAAGALAGQRVVGEAGRVVVWVGLGKLLAVLVIGVVPGGPDGVIVSK